MTTHHHDHSHHDHGPAHAHHHDGLAHGHAGAPHPPAAVHASLLRLSFAERLAGAGVVIALLWAVVYWAAA